MISKNENSWSQKVIPEIHEPEKRKFMISKNENSWFIKSKIHDLEKRKFMIPKSNTPRLTLGGHVSIYSNNPLVKTYWVCVGYSLGYKPLD